MPTEQNQLTEEGFELHFRERPSGELKLRLPLDVIASLEKVAAAQDKSAEALVKFYIGQSLRQGLAKLLANRVLEKTAQVLTHHLESEEEVSEILKEIRAEATT
jgi:hypothetical protein